MKQQASRYASTTTLPALTLVRELLVDVRLTARTLGQAGDHLQDIRRRSPRWSRLDQYFDITLESLDGRLELDMAALEPPADSNRLGHRTLRIAQFCANRRPRLNAGAVFSGPEPRSQTIDYTS